VRSRVDNGNRFASFVVTRWLQTIIVCHDKNYAIITIIVILQKTRCKVIIVIIVKGLSL
jgi:hypothetical protein